uniref:Uncharacterized protein n=1 Tax=Anguilla anguilla TaxID=7936 RepID=A0A0E9QR75_ANGAN
MCFTITDFVVVLFTCIVLFLIKCFRYDVTGPPSQGTTGVFEHFIKWTW